MRTVKLIFGIVCACFSTVCEIGFLLYKGPVNGRLHFNTCVWLTPQAYMLCKYDNSVQNECMFNYEEQYLQPEAASFPNSLSTRDSNALFCFC